MEQAATSTALQYGVLGIVALAFAFAVVQLFKIMRTDHAASKADAVAMEKERKKWAIEREAMRLEFERKHRELVESYAEAASDERASNRAHEDLVRKEFAELMEQVAEEGGKSAQTLVDMMQKFYDRFVGPTRGR